MHFKKGERKFFAAKTAILIVLTFFLSCANSDIVPWSDPNSSILVNNRLRLEGSVCNQEPSDTVTPVKVLFVLDNSGSLDYPMGQPGTDPDRDDGTNLRQDAVREVVNRFGGHPAYWFGQIQFNQASGGPPTSACPISSNPDDSGMAFTQDEANYILDCVNNINTPTGATPMLSALTKAYEEIYEDLKNTPAVQRVRTIYSIIFFSDGIPDDGISDCNNNWPDCVNSGNRDPEGNAICPGQPDRSENEENIYQAATEIMRLETEEAEIKAKEIKINVVFLQRTGSILTKSGPCSNLDTVDERVTYARELLQTVASIGKGTYLEYDSDQLINPTDPDNPGSPLDFVQFVATNIKSVFTFKSFVVANLNARLSGEGELLPDSDADGLTDRYELERGLDPVNWDTDGDYLGDKVEIVLGKDAKTADSTCGLLPEYAASDFLDTDMDMLNDCEERYLFTDPKLPDTDADGIIDSLELYYDMDPKKKDALNDNNQDGTNNSSEIIVHTEPGLNLSADIKDRYGYKYTFVPSNAGYQDMSQFLTKCFDFEVKNISLVKPKPLPGLPIGLNDILIYGIETLQDNHDEYGSTFIGHYSATYAGPGFKYPASGVFEVDFTDFNIWGKLYKPETGF
jgi:hypothetical protein